MKEKIRQFMIGRYGTDGLNQFLNIASLVLILVYILTRLPLLLYVGALVVRHVLAKPSEGASSPSADSDHQLHAPHTGEEA